MSFARIADRAERLVYRVAGLPIAISALVLTSSTDPSDPLQSAFAWRYWHPDGAGEWSDLVGGLVLWPLAVIVTSALYTWRNGKVIRSRYGKPIAAQFLEQLKLYLSAGVLAPWYYIFSLYDGDAGGRARTYLQRFETKPSIFMLLKRKRGSPLTDKVEFARYCVARRIRCVPNLLELRGERVSGALPDHDLFVKPIKERGGKGAERWDRVGAGSYSDTRGKRIGAAELLAYLVEKSRRMPLVVQRRITAHPRLSDLTAGALPTVRVVSCLDERQVPELIGAVFRMSVGTNATVDNLHAGGIAAAVDLRTGTLSRATNLGADARLGWLSRHPDTGAIIEGQALPFWKETKELAATAHRHFTDRVVIGCDIAIVEDGPIIVEGNGNPDMDILQRFMREGLRKHRFAELLAYHLRARAPSRA